MPAHPLTCITMPRLARPSQLPRPRHRRAGDAVVATALGCRAQRRERACARSRQRRRAPLARGASSGGRLGQQLAQQRLDSRRLGTRRGAVRGQDQEARPAGAVLDRSRDGGCGAGRAAWQGNSRMGDETAVPYGAWAL
jgi:hypothetical protein